MYLEEKMWYKNKRLATKAGNMLKSCEERSAGNVIRKRKRKRKKASKWAPTSSNQKIEGT